MTRTAAAKLSADEPTQQFAIELPKAERGLTADQIARYDRARAMLAQTRFKLTDEQREGHLRTIEAIERAGREWQDKAWRDEARAETVALASARGEEAAIRPSGAVHVHSRDGLLALLRAGRLTVEQYDAGMTYRALWERQAQGPSPEPGATGGAHDNSKYVFGALQRAKACIRLGAIERAVALQCRDEPSALQMLRYVAGQGNSPRAFGGGRAYERHIRALARALDVAAAGSADAATKRGLDERNKIPL